MSERTNFSEALNSETVSLLDDTTEIFGQIVFMHLSYQQEIDFSQKLQNNRGRQLKALWDWMLRDDERVAITRCIACELLE